ncbi:alkaline phosphatase family protein [Bifidobacterium sp.]|uniref:alkaline phosphatase family protein n=1 Tax=Bifidobacterium sp. TaxID=41200 RepID=UPI0025B89588|nr:alkaline phosphatase family protein [Bifidobacterium sp.]MCI1225219.1 alkaline phosphatase family protein [Bifidobacterium sp.]
MSVDVPDRKTLLEFVATARYGDFDGMANGTGGDLAATVLQRGGARHLSSVLPAVSSAIGRPVTTAVHRDPGALQTALGFPDASSAIVVLVDGLGFWNLNLRIGHVPYLRSLLREPVNQQPISTCSPSTTVAAMATFGTGTCPGLTGMAGYTQRNPQTGELSQLIQFRNAIEPRDLQRQPTIFERLAGQGVPVTSSGLPKFADSPLTQAALRGAHFIGNAQPGSRVRAACRAAQKPGLTYLYIRDTDKTGHTYGWNSPEWIAALESVDAQLGMLHRNAPRGTLIVIVADHGMVSALPEERIDIALTPQLKDGVGMVGGEPRAPMLYASEGCPAGEIAARWRDYLGARALVRTRDQAIAEGLLGPVDPRVEPMIGDVLVQVSGNMTIVDSRIQSDKATRLPSVHGSQTLMEMDVPCLIDAI